MDLQVAAVDAVVVGDHHARQLHVLVPDGLQGAVHRVDDEVQPAQGGLLELGQLLLEVESALIGHGG